MAWKAPQRHQWAPLQLFTAERSHLGSNTCCELVRHHTRNHWRASVARHGSANAT